MNEIRGATHLTGDVHVRHNVLLTSLLPRCHTQQDLVSLVREGVLLEDAASRAIMVSDAVGAYYRGSNLLSPHPSLTPTQDEFFDPAKSRLPKSFWPDLFKTLRPGQKMVIGLRSAESTHLLRLPPDQGCEYQPSSTHSIPSSHGPS